MNDVVRLESANQMLRTAFLRWQCRARQMCVRDNEGKPDNAMIPAVYINDDAEPMGHIITVMCKSAQFSKVPELKYMVQRSHDPAKRRTEALTLLSETYYQKSSEFSDILTSTFMPDSEGARALRQAKRCQLHFSAFSQSYRLDCKVWRLSRHNPLWQATYWHNMLFNPALPPDTVILGFEPDWSACHADPSPI